MDDKVHPSHKHLEGHVFNYDYDMMHPEVDYGCRCYSQELPINARIIEKESKPSDGEETKKMERELYLLHPAPKKEYFINTVP